MPLFETVTDLASGADIIRRRRYGVIETAAGRLTAVRFRPFPKWASLLDVFWFGRWQHESRRAGSDRCQLYFNQPRRFSNFLAVPFMVSGRGATLHTVFAALATLDEIARIKRSDALLADLVNSRISPRLMARQGWQPHKPSRWHRHYIKRFYGEYPPSRATS